MQYTTEDLSPVQKKISVIVPSEECDAALSAAVAMYRASVSLDGFRKGKVPASLIEKRFHKEITKEATTDLVNVHINQIIGELKVTPVSRLDFEGEDIARGQEYCYSFAFEVMPEFEVPSYEGFAVEQTESEVEESEVNEVIERLRGNMAEVVPVTENRGVQAGDIAVIDFSASDEKGQNIPGVTASNFQLSIGEGQTLPEFENLVMGMKAGETKEGPVPFPADFFNPEFAGRTLVMKAVLHAIKEKKLPEVNEEFAQKAGGFDTVEKLRDSVRDSYKKSREDLYRGEAQKNLLDGLLKLVDFPVPPSMLESHVDMMAGEVVDRLQRQGKGLQSIGKTEEQVREEVLPEAEVRAKSQIFLLGVARKCELSMSDQEVDMQLRRMAMQSGQDYNAVKEYYTRHNLMFALRDRLLADKAMDEIYSKASVKIVPAKAEEAKK